MPFRDSSRLQNYAHSQGSASSEFAHRDPSPAGDYAELLVKLATGGELAPNSQKSWDIKTPDGEHLQVKARMVTNPRNAGERQLSVFRSWELTPH